MDLHDVVIKPADKAGNVVIWPVRMYEREAFRQLRDQRFYNKLTYNPLSNFQVELRTLLDKAHRDGIISRGTLESLFVEAPKIACFYLLPKIHKNCTTPLPPPPFPLEDRLCLVMKVFVNLQNVTV